MPPKESQTPETARRDTAQPAKRRKKRVSPLRVIGRTLVVLLLSAAFLFAFLYAVCFVVTNGPSEQAQHLFVLSVNETSALKFLPYWFLPEQQVREILDPAADDTAPDLYQEIGYEPGGDKPIAEEEQALVHIDADSFTDEVEVIDIRKPTFKGKMLIVHDPSRVIVATLDQYGGQGLLLTQFVDRYKALAGTNAGGFEDAGGMGEGGSPDGLVIINGQIDWGAPGGWYPGVIGLDSDYKLHVGNMTGQEALDLGLVYAVNYSAGRVLIKDGVKAQISDTGLNPRTCIGQRADGAVLLVVIEGRHVDSIGATIGELADLMEEYGAVNAGNLDGGSSSTMVYDGVQITKGSTLVGARQICTSILVLREGGTY